MPEAQPHDDGGAVSHGIALQCALRALLVVFVGVTLYVEPPTSSRWLYALFLFGYAVAFAAWAVWALRREADEPIRTRRSITLLMLGADLTIVAVLSVLTAIASPESWTSNMLRTGLFLIH